MTPDTPEDYRSTTPDPIEPDASEPIPASTHPDVPDESSVPPASFDPSESLLDGLDKSSESLQGTPLQVQPGSMSDDPAAENAENIDSGDEVSSEAMLAAAGTDTGTAGAAKNTTGPTADDDVDALRVNPFINEKEDEERIKKLDAESDAREKAQRDHRLLDFSTVDRIYLKHIDSVFENPPGYKDFLDRVKHDPLRDNRIFIIAGKRNSGRYAVALDLALTLNNKRNPPSIYEYVPDANTSTFSLQEILSKLTKRDSDDKDKGLPRHSVLIIRDLFEESRNHERELSRAYAQRFKKILNG